jgi:CHAD domain-containing protein
MNPVPFLHDSLEKRWKTFRRRIRRGLPLRGRRQTDEAVRALRTASRRLLSVLEAVECVGARKHARRLARRVDRILSGLGPLRDLTVQREMLSRVPAKSGRSALRSFERSVERDFRRSSRKARRRLSREDLASMKEDERRILRKLRPGRQDGDGSDARRKILGAIQAASASLKARRAAIDPTRAATVHEMRIALKNFRYLMESLKPLAPGVSKRTLESLHALQTTMGDLHDLEVLSSSLATHVAKESPERQAELAPVLAELEAKHSKMLQSFLKTADPILEYWNGVLAAVPTAKANSPELTSRALVSVSLTGPAS